MIAKRKRQSAILRILYLIMYKENPLTASWNQAMDGFMYLLISNGITPIIIDISLSRINHKIVLKVSIHSSVTNNK